MFMKMYLTGKTLVSNANLHNVSSNSSLTVSVDKSGLKRWILELLEWPEVPEVLLYSPDMVSKRRKEQSAGSL